MGENAPGTSEGVATEQEQKVQPPPMFRVLLHNDEYTTMDFVVQVLQSVFKKPTDEAVRIMLNVHHNGVGMCGTYASQVAETKVAAVYNLAQDHGFPLKCSMEPE